MIRLQPTRLAKLSNIFAIAALLISQTSSAATVTGVCGDVLNSTGTLKLTSQTQQSNVQQKLGYCKAASAADEAAKNQKEAATVWVGVAGVCMVACYKQQNPTAAQAVGFMCKIANAGGGFSDKLLDQRTQDFQKQLEAAATIQQQQPVNPQNPNPLPSFVPPAAVKPAGSAMLEQIWRDVRIMKDALSLLNDAHAADAAPAAGALPIAEDACLNAATAAGNAFQKMQAAKGQEQTRDENLKFAAQLNTNNDPRQNAPGIVGGLGAVPNFDQSAGGAPAASAAKTAEAGVVGGHSAAADAAAGSCTGAGDSAAIIACVSKRDPSLPPIVNDPAFQQQFEKQTGQSLGDLVKSGENPVSAASRVLGSAVGDEGKNLVAAATSAFAKNIADDMNKLADASAVASKDSGAGAAATDPLAFDAPAAAPPANVTQDFDRKPASTPSKGKLTLFEIVTERYHLVMDRVDKLAWSTPYNRMMGTGSNAGSEKKK